MTTIDKTTKDGTFDKLSKRERLRSPVSVLN